MKHHTGDGVSARVTAILVYTGLLLEESYGSLYPRQEEILKQVLQAATELKEIILENPSRFVQD